MFITIGVYTPLYSFSLFLPTIVKNLGFTNDKVSTAYVDAIQTLLLVN